MRKRNPFAVVTMFLFMLTAACTVQGTSTVVPDITAVPVAPVITEDLNETTQVTLPSVETAEPSCLGDKIHPIGKAIADEYETANYDQIMTWFCSGAEFEDILVALETEIQTDTAADDVLQMLAAGFSWNDIWLTIGFTD
jgi:hypothetical protein